MGGCAYLRCENYSPTAKSLCDWHHKEITSKKNYLGVCWNCGTIHLIAQIPKYMKDSLTERILFTKQCFKCDPNRLTLDWVTLNKTYLPTIYVDDKSIYIEQDGNKKILYNFPNPSTRRIDNG